MKWKGLCFYYSLGNWRILDFEVIVSRFGRSSHEYRWHWPYSANGDTRCKTGKFLKMVILEKGNIFLIYTANCIISNLYLSLKNLFFDYALYFMETIFWNLNNINPTFFTSQTGTSTTIVQERIPFIKRNSKCWCCNTLSRYWVFTKKTSYTHHIFRKGFLYFFFLNWTLIILQPKDIQFHIYFCSSFGTEWV